MKRILVADDEVDIVEGIREMLSLYYEVGVATSGIEVLKMCHDTIYDGLIIDIDFVSGINGLEVSSILRSRDKNIKIIVFSATNYSDSIRQQVVDMGATFIEKPLDVDTVHRIMEA